MKVWVTRDKGGNICGENPIQLWKKRPELKGGMFVSTRDVSLFVSKRFFVRFFDFTPRKGSCKQMNLTLTEIE